MKRAWMAYMVLVLSVLSCQVFTNQSGGEDVVSVQPTDGAQPTEVEPADYFLPDPGVGLDSLQSYAQALSISFTGTQDGESVQYTDTYTRKINRETHTQFTYLAITDAEGSQKQSVVGDVGEAHYSKSGDEACRVFWGEPAEGVEPFLPARLLPPLPGVHEAGSELVNGIQARRYTFDADSLGGPSGVKIEGQVWLAVEGGYVVKYFMRIQDEGTIFGEGTKGEQIYEYELNEINAVSGPELPEDCPAVLTDFPAMPDAFDIERLPQTLAYTSPSDVSQLSAFYEQQLQGLGWTMSSTHPYPQDGNTLVFLHETDSKIAFVTLQAAGSDTWVTVKVELMQETIPGMIP